MDWHVTYHFISELTTPRHKNQTVWHENKLLKKQIKPTTVLVCWNGLILNNKPRKSRENIPLREDLNSKRFSTHLQTRRPNNLPQTKMSAQFILVFSVLPNLLLNSTFNILLSLSGTETKKCQKLLFYSGTGTGIDSLSSVRNQKKNHVAILIRTSSPFTLENTHC
jgi:hypothetical protein